MNGRAALTSYLVNAISLVGYPAILIRILGSEGNGALGFNYVYIVILSIFGMVLAPYFEVASLIVNKGEVWKEVGHLIHRHISMPFLGGYALSFLAIYPAAFLFGLGFFNQTLIFDPILVTYLAFVLAASAITVMSNRKPAAILSPANQDPTHATS